ncbi:MAG: hypothetical protein PHP55_07350 [Methanoculleus sp.]|nr:hypothetical protein [Methanoculleus sp.]
MRRTARPEASPTSASTPAGPTPQEAPVVYASIGLVVVGLVAFAREDQKWS